MDGGEGRERHRDRGREGTGARGVGAGNACKILIALAAAPAAHDALLRDGACDALVAALSSPGPDGDPTSALVRKNAAAAVARLMKSDACAAAAPGGDAA